MEGGVRIWTDPRFPRSSASTFFDALKNKVSSPLFRGALIRRDTCIEHCIMHHEDCTGRWTLCVCLHLNLSEQSHTAHAITQQSVSYVSRSVDFLVVALVVSPVQLIMGAA